MPLANVCGAVRFNKPTLLFCFLVLRVDVCREALQPVPGKTPHRDRLHHTVNYLTAGDVSVPK